MPGGVALEIEVQLRDPTLQHAPHRLPKIGHESHQPKGCKVALALRTEIGAQQPPVVIDVELVVDREVRQVEEPVAHPGVLPIHNPDRPVVEEVGVEQVVVAGHEPLFASRRPNPSGHRPRRRELRGDGNAVGLGRRAVLPHHRPRVEPSGNGRRVMKPAQRAGDALECLGPPHLLQRDGRSRDEARHEPSLLGHESGHLRTNADLERPLARGVLDGAVDAEEVCLRAAHAQNENLVADLDLEVAIRDPAAELFHRRGEAWPQLSDGVAGGVHKSRIVSA